METKYFLKQHNACFEGAKWALSIGEEMDAVWNAMIEQGKHKWLLWTATRPGVFSDSILRKLACRFIRETPIADGRKVWDLLEDNRSRRAVEVAESYADGKATYEELEAAHAAAYDAACDAYDAAADAAAYDATNAAHAARADDVAAYVAACNAANAARAATYAAARDAAEVAYAAAYGAAKAAQVQMIAELGNPFK